LDYYRSSDPSTTRNYTGTTTMTDDTFIFEGKYVRVIFEYGLYSQGYR
jgi:hypothetical protein